MPKAGAYLQQGSVICLYDSDDITSRTLVNIPNLKGLSVSDATSKLRSVNLNISIEGSRKSN